MDKRDWDLYDWLQWQDEDDAAPRPPSNPSPTSKDAADDKAGSAATDRRRVLECVAAAPDGLTRDGIAAALGMLSQSVSPRVWELLKLRALIETAERRPTRSGCGAFVLRVAPPAAATPAPTPAPAATATPATPATPATEGGR